LNSLKKSSGVRRICVTGPSRSWGYHQLLSDMLIERGREVKYNANTNDLNSKPNYRTMGI